MGIPRFYYNGLNGAPELTVAVGSLVSVLDKVLVSGYPTASVSLTHAAGVVTGTYTSHGFSAGQKITISGATQDEYNGQVTVATTPDADTFTYTPLTNPTVSPATGSPVVNTAAGFVGLGWQLVATDTNKRLYRPRYGTRMYLAVDDNVSNYYARIRGFESADTASVTVAGNNIGAFPTDAQLSGGLYVNKNNNSASAYWRIFGDDKTFYLSTQPGNTTACIFNGFGDFTSYKAGDAYNCFITAKTSAQTSYAGNGGFSTNGSLVASWSATSPGIWIPRNYAQVGTSLAVGIHSDRMRHRTAMIGGSGNNPGVDTLPFPDLITGGLHLARLFVREAGPLRGHFRGIWMPCHRWIASGNTQTLQYNGIVHDTIVSGSGEAAARVFRAQVMTDNTNYGCMMCETTDTWD